MTNKADISYMYGEDIARAMSGEAGKVPTVTIEREIYEDLLERDALLTSLEHAGVDNWDGYDFAMEIYNAFNNDAG